MGILNKILFWRHDDEFDFDSLADKDLGKAPLHDDPLGLDQKPEGLEEASSFDEIGRQGDFSETRPAYPSSSPSRPQASPFAARQPAAVPASMHDRDLELISSKLDTVKAILSSMDQRISNLERAAGVERKERLW